MSTPPSSIEPLPPLIANIVTGETEPDGAALCELREHLKRLKRRFEDEQRDALAKVASASKGLVDALLRTGGANLDHVLVAVHGTLEGIEGLMQGVPTAAPKETSSVGIALHDTAWRRKPATPVAHTTPMPKQQPTPGLSLDDHELQSEFGKLLEAVREGARAGSGQSQGNGQAAPPGLQTANKRRLGEILVSLAMINRDDLETALRMQQVTGRRVGETLIEMGLLTPEQLEGALRAQS